MQKTQDWYKNSHTIRLDKGIIATFETVREKHEGWNAFFKRFYDRYIELETENIQLLKELDQKNRLLEDKYEGI